MRVRAGLPALLGLLALLIGGGCTGPPTPEWTERQPPIRPLSEITDQREKEQLRFLVFGDSGSGTKVQRRIGRAMAEICRERGGCDFALVAGDLIYDASKGEAAFHERFEAAYEPLGRLDFWMVAGNHDWYQPGLVDAEVRYSETSPRWRMLSHDYAVPLLPDWIHIYGLDTTKLEYGIEDGQVERAREELCGAEGWRLLLGHHPVYSSGFHGKTTGELPAIKSKLLEPLIERCGVQFYFAGHDHDQQHLSAPGFEQVVQGAAAKLRRLRAARERDPEVRRMAAESAYGFALLEVTAERLVLRFYGESEERGAEPFHCRVFERADFGDPDRRSQACTEAHVPD